MRNLDRKREYDRERMARLYANDQTWWQAHPQARWNYDRYRSFARGCESLALACAKFGREAEMHELEAMAQQNNDRAREAARKWSDADFLAKVAKIEADYQAGKPVVRKVTLLDVLQGKAA
jgi:hypothetical protein